MDKMKRERSANFSLHERDILVSLILKYQTIIENKQSDASTWKMKEDAWKKLQIKFNARSGSTPRSVKTLKVKYDGLKRTVRKKSAAIRSELYRTGGGKNTAIPLDNVEEQIKSVISLSTDGLENIYDSDMLPAEPHTQQSQDGIDVPTMEEFIQIPSLETDTETRVEREASQNQVLLLVTQQCDTMPPTIPEVIPEMNPDEKTALVNANDKDSEVGLGTISDSSWKNILTPTSANKKWDVRSRKNLKSRKHPALIANVPKKTRFDELTEAKLELVQLQKSLLESEAIEKKKV